MASECSKCGLPRLLSRAYAWRDGCIVEKSTGAANFSFYEVSFHDALMDMAKNQLGMPIDRIMYNADRHAARAVISDMLTAHPLLGKLAFKAPFYKQALRVTVELGKVIGLGNIEILEFKKGEGGRFRVSDPFYLMHCVGIIAGIQQMIDGMRFEVDITEEGDHFLVETVRPSAEPAQEESYARMTVGDLTPAKTDPEYRLPGCKGCRAPRQVGDLFDFDMQRGIITEEESGERFVLIGIHSFNALIREFRKELGDSVDNIIIGTEKKSFKRKLAEWGRAGELWDEASLRDYLALRGLGMLSEMKQEGEKTSFTVKNAFIAPVVAGRLIALWEHQHKKECPYELSIFKNTLILVISAQ